MNDALTKIYYDPGKPGSYGGVEALKRASKKHSKRDVEAWLRAQNAYTLHKQVRRRFQRNKVLVTTIDEQFQADLVDLSNISEFNDGYKFLLVVIDVFSRFCWIRPLKNKSSASIIKAFTSIFESGRKCYVLQTDKGSEFLNRQFKRFLKENDVRHFSTESDVKASMVERLNRTIKTKMWRYFTHRNTYRYIDVLQKFVHSYNHSYHRSIRRTPASVNENSVKSVWQTLHRGSTSNNKSNKFKVGDKVRVSKAKFKFEKGYLPNWSEELFTVVKVLKRKPYVYKIEDLNNQLIDGIFYENELQKVTTSNDDVYRIEKIIERKGKKVLVRWKGYGPEFDTYIRAADLIRYHQ